MNTEWKTLPLGAICRFRAGSAFPQARQGSRAGVYPFIKVSDMELPGNAYRISVANNWVDSQVATELKAAIHPPGSTVFAKIGIALTYNRRRILTQPTIIDNNSSVRSKIP